MAVKEFETKINVSEENEKQLAYTFVEENRELLEMLTDRLIGYAMQGNALAVNWMAQSLMGLIKQANETCKDRLGVGAAKMQ